MSTTTVQTDPTHRPPPSRRGRAALVMALGAALTASALAVLAPAQQATAAVPAEGAPAPTFEAPYLAGDSGPEPERDVSLAGTWRFTPVTTTVCTPGPRATIGPMACVDTPASGEASTIQVPGGGWLKQGWAHVSVADYERSIDVPAIAGEQATRLAFGAINHRATVWVDGREVASQVTAYTSSEFDISDYVQPGRPATIRVRVEGRKALVGSDGRYTVPDGASWSDDVAQGIFRSAHLQVFPAVRIADTVVRTSVEDRTLSYDVVVSNSTAKDRRVRLSGTLGSWNKADWKYPAVPATSVTVPAGSSRTVTVGPLRWRGGTDSYWWPNLPYRPGYRAQLHDLQVTASTVRAGQKVLDARASVRFGFRELEQVGQHYELNGRKVNFRGDSLQGANYDNIDFHGRSDAYDTLPGFLAPSVGNGGWPQTVENYLRLNFNSVRIHQIPATPYMLDVADERGLMIQDETAIRGSNNRQNFITGKANMVKHLGDLVKRDRNHASVLRWSQSNEPEVGYTSNPGAGRDFDETLYRTVMALDTTRPISTDGAIDASATDLPHDNYTVFCHYADGVYPPAYTESICSGPAGKPQGQGEFVWPGDNTLQGATWFATGSLRMREKGADEVRPYTLLDLWASVVPGTRTSDITVEWLYPNGKLHPLYGEDNLPDPWSNPRIRLIQNAFNPVAVIDTDFYDANKRSDAQGQWPTAPGAVVAGRNTRTMTLFNDTLFGTALTVDWALHTGTAAGTVVDSGSIAASIPVGTSSRMPVTFEAPAGQGQLYLELTVSKPGEGTLFHDTSTVYTVSPTND